MGNATSTLAVLIAVPAAVNAARNLIASFYPAPEPPPTTGIREEVQAVQQENDNRWDGISNRIERLERLPANQIAIRRQRGGPSRIPRPTRDGSGPTTQKGIRLQWNPALIPRWLAKSNSHLYVVLATNLQLVWRANGSRTASMLA
jgi:hypothetical protein